LCECNIFYFLERISSSFFNQTHQNEYQETNKNIANKSRNKFKKERKKKKKRKRKKEKEKKKKKENGNEK